MQPQPEHVEPANRAPSDTPPEPANDAPASDTSNLAWSALHGVGVGLATVSHWIARGARSAAHAAAKAYRTVDPDVRRHLGHMPLVGLTHVARWPEQVQALDDDGHRVLLFVHGIGGSPGNFTLMRAYLRLRGRRRAYGVALQRGQSIAEMGSQLALAIEAIAHANALPARRSIDVIAHSMGGLVVRAALLADEQAAARLHTIVTLGTPHAGTYAARYAQSPSLLDLRPDSDLLNRLQQQIPWKGLPSSPHLVAFWSRSDVLLLPPESARVPGAENVEAPGFSHYGYLLHPAAWVDIAAVLERSEQTGGP